MNRQVEATLELNEKGKVKKAPISMNHRGPGHLINTTLQAPLEKIKFAKSLLTMCFYI